MVDPEIEERTEASCEGFVILLGIMAGLPSHCASRDYASKGPAAWGFHPLHLDFRTAHPALPLGPVMISEDFRPPQFGLSEGRQKVSVNGRSIERLTLHARTAKLKSLHSAVFWNFAHRRAIPNSQQEGWGR